MTPQQKQVVLALAKAMFETVNEAGAQGAPATSLYMACSEHGVSYNVFTSIMQGLVSAGLVKCRNHTYYSLGASCRT